MGYRESGQSRANQGVPRFACDPDLNQAPFRVTTEVSFPAEDFQGAGQFSGRPQYELGKVGMGAHRLLQAAGVAFAFNSAASA